MKTEIKHLLIPGEFKVYCLPNRMSGLLAITNKPSKTTCANCLTSYRRKSGQRHPDFKVAHTSRPSDGRDHEGHRCAVCGGVIYLESAAEGYSCKQCGSSDSDE